jgi:acyl-coenzyme A synthetase/AMP-(fatty) acid ligase
VSLSELVDGGGDIERCFDPNATHHAMISSGTTNLPKVSLWTDNNLRFFLGTYARRVGLTAKDVALQIAPASTGSTGYVFPVLAPLLYGASSIMTDSWNVRRALDILESRRPTLATAIPTQMIKMMQDPSCAGRVIDSLRVFTNAGAALAPEWAERVESIFACRIHTCYGASDGGVPAMTAANDPEPKRIASVGRVVEEGGCRLVDESMSDVPAGCVGEVIWRNATKSLGYLNDPVRTDEAFWGDSWYRSGDLGRFDEDGYLHIVGRVKDIIIRGGQNINPAEVETLVALHPAVLDVALVGLPDPVYGQRSCACVVLRDGHTLDFDELAAHLRDYDLAAFKLPESLELFTELPYNTGHKVIKHELVGLVQLRREQVSS